MTIIVMTYMYINNYGIKPISAHYYPAHSYYTKSGNCGS